MKYRTDPRRFQPDYESREDFVDDMASLADITAYADTRLELLRIADELEQYARGVFGPWVIAQTWTEA